MPTILIVDDKSIFREPIEAVLDAEGFETVTASNGQEALAAIGASPPTLVLLDLGMPVMDGMAVLRYMRQSSTLRSIPVIILSAEADRARITEAIKLGISGYLLKSGFSLKDMLAKIKTTLDESASTTSPSPSDSAPTDSVPTTSPAGTATPEGMKNAAPLPAPGADLTGSGAAAQTQPLPGPVASVIATGPPRDVAADVKLLRPIIVRSDLMDRLKSCEELSGLSPTVCKVLKLTASENSSLDSISKAISQDQAMAIKILKIANSSIYSRGDRVETLHKAVLRIGMASIRQAVLNIGVVERYSSPAFQEHISTQQFWEHSIACGIIAAEISHASGAEDADSAFTSGLLHDLGRVIFAEVLGEEYIHVIETAKRLRAPLEMVETRMLLLNHADVMDRLLSAWKFPKPLVDPITHHHLSAGNVRSVAPSRVQEILRLGLANRLAHAMLLGNSGNETIYPTEEHCRGLKINADTIKTIEETARQQTDDTKFALLSTTNGTVWHRRADEVRATLTVPFRPLYISATPDLDAYNIFCNELAGPLGDEPPNIAVLHLTSAMEREPLAESLIAAEQAASVKNLPLLVLSPAGKLSPPDQVTKTRAIRLLATPVPVSHFVETVGELVQGVPAQSAAA